MCIAVYTTVIYGITCYVTPIIFNTTLYNILALLCAEIWRYKILLRRHILITIYFDYSAWRNFWTSLYRRTGSASSPIQKPRRKYYNVSLLMRRISVVDDNIENLKIRKRNKYYYCYTDFAHILIPDITMRIIKFMYRLQLSERH